MPATPPWLAAAEAMLNRNIDASSHASMLARRLSGATLQVEVDGFTRVRALIHAGRLNILAGDDSPADAVISGSPAALLSLLRTASAPSPTANRRNTAQIRGNAEIANLYKELFSVARPDLEEELARFIGDLPARHVARIAQELGTWLKRTRRIAGENLAEYWQEESRDLPSRTEAEEFLHGVDQLREAADRLEARLGRLQQRARSPG
jgi:ubiquinone biosynthesis accessory factor UbiJ